MKEKKSLINIFLLKVSEYNEFFIIHAISKQLGKSQFLIKKNNADNQQSQIKQEELIVGLIYSIIYIEKEKNNSIIEYKIHEKINLLQIKPIRLFAIQSICSLIYKAIHNIDDVNKIVNLIPKILLIFINENWLKKYLYLELKILIIYDNDSIITNYNKVEQINLILNNKILNTNKTLQLKKALQEMEKLWYAINANFVIPEERYFLYKILNIYS